ncbi:hypothetical protein JGU66_26625 [Myxococcaceae bacterium JPH2]|nr:hypothetical protein [Myxococcaceae bacterium JPH2]
MTSPHKSLLFALLVLTASCDVLKTSDVEGTRGRGARAFDPYSSSASGAISLSLLYFNGCAMLPNGEAVSRGSLDLPDYPATCAPLNSGIPLGKPAEPTARFRVVAGETYFLREFTAVDAVFGDLVKDVPNDFNDRHAPSVWMRKMSRFKDLDWSGVTIGHDTWRNDGGSVFIRETFYENAAWMVSLDDTFLVEVLDASNTVRASVTYKRTDFLSESPVTGRTRASWTVGGLSRPLSPGDPVPHQAGPDAPSYKTIIKASFVNSTNPFKSFRMPEQAGEGFIRVTWSLLPNKPFLSPVTFVANKDREATCYKLDANGMSTTERVACGFGLTQSVRLQRPTNGQFYQPGETVEFAVSLQDGDGNGLHARDRMPSYNSYIASESNGLSYFNDAMLLSYRDASASESGYKVVGPLQDIKVVHGELKLPYFAFPRGEPQFYLPAGVNKVAGGGDAEPSTRYGVQLPPDAKPGTYAIFLKGHRSFLGERLARLDPFFFQVGQAQPTTYPGRVGNCQLCHNGVNSLTNIHHGLSVDHVEACKTCHLDESVGYLPDSIHRIHMGSRKYNQNKGDCTVCHLTRESALFPSIMACNGCHGQSHGTEYFDLQFQPVTNTPNGYGNCAQACHVTTPPAEHILPAR